MKNSCYIKIDCVGNISAFMYEKGLFNKADQMFSVQTGCEIYSPTLLEFLDTGFLDTGFLDTGFLNTQ